jgi:hypothetical protein
MMKCGVCWGSIKEQRANGDNLYTRNGMRITAIMEVWGKPSTAAASKEGGETSDGDEVRY